MVIIQKINLAFICCIIFVFSFSIGARASYTSETFQRSLYDIGYQEVHQALKESVEHFKCDIPLPVQTVPISFTHSFGRLNDLEGEENDSFEIEYYHMDKPNHHYMIWVKPAKFGLKLNPELMDQTIKLREQGKAIYSTKIARGFNVLMFERNDLQYILNIDKHVSDQVPVERLVEIANSIWSDKE